MVARPQADLNAHAGTIRCRKDTVKVAEIMDPRQGKLRLTTALGSMDTIARV